MSTEVPALSDDASPEVQTQMQVSYQVWLSLANAIAHSGGMSAAAVADLKRQHRAQINTECAKFQALE